MSDRLDPHTLRVVLAEAWWRGRCSANARHGEWAGPELRERCAKDIADLTARAEAPPETGHTAESCGQCECCEAWRATHDEALADVARLTAENAALKAKLDATTDDFGCVPVSFSSVIDGIDSRQTQEAVENLVVWHMRRAEKAEAERDAALATATEAAETVARLTAERDAARAQTWAEAIAVVERMPQASLPDTYSEDPDIISRSEVLAALRAKQKEEPK